MKQPPDFLLIFSAHRMVHSPLIGSSRLYAGQVCGTGCIAGDWRRDQTLVRRDRASRPRLGGVECACVREWCVCAGWVQLGVRASAGRSARAWVPRRPAAPWPPPRRTARTPRAVRPNRRPPSTANSRQRRPPRALWWVTKFIFQSRWTLRRGGRGRSLYKDAALDALCADEGCNFAARKGREGAHPLPCRSLDWGAGSRTGPGDFPNAADGVSLPSSD